MFKLQQLTHLPSMAPNNDPKNALTDRERELMALAWLCFSEKPKVSHHRKLSTHTQHQTKNHTLETNQILNKT